MDDSTIGSAAVVLHVAVDLDMLPATSSVMAPYRIYGQYVGAPSSQVADLRGVPRLGPHTRNRRQQICAVSRRLPPQTGEAEAGALLHYLRWSRRMSPYMAGDLALSCRVVSRSGRGPEAEPPSHQSVAVVLGSPTPWRCPRDTAVVRLLGDPAQLSSIETGGTVRVLAHDAGAVELTDLHGSPTPTKQPPPSVVRLPHTYVELGYATSTAHAVGRTVDTTHVLVDQTMTRAALYVAAPRGRAGTHPYVLNEQVLSLGHAERPPAPNLDVTYALADSDNRDVAAHPVATLRSRGRQDR